MSRECAVCGELLATLTKLQRHLRKDHFDFWYYLKWYGSSKQREIT